MVKPDTKTVLLDAAEWAARRHGHDGFSYADLSKRVGIRTAKKKLVSLDEPIANSSQFNLPSNIAPSFQIF